MIKIKSYKIQKQGHAGVALTLPKVWIDDMKLKPGDAIDVFRDEVDNLILRVRKNGNRHEEES